MSTGELPTSAIEAGTQKLYNKYLLNESIVIAGVKEGNKNRGGMNTQELGKRGMWAVKNQAEVFPSQWHYELEKS